MSADLRDEPVDRPVLASRISFPGRVWDVRTDDVELPHGEVVTRDIVVHPGAVGIIALDQDDRVLLVQQYRHPVGMLLWEPPAGLLDVAGEPPLLTAQRELVEEAGLVAREWHVLADWFNSPGGNTEAFRCFLARGISPAPGGRPDGHGEEYDLPMRWVPLAQARDAALAGGLMNPTLVAGVLAAIAHRDAGWAELRPGDAPWPARDHLLATDRVRPMPSTST